MLKYFIFFSFLLVINLSIAISHDSSEMETLIKSLSKKSFQNLSDISTGIPSDMYKTFSEIKDKISADLPKTFSDKEDEIPKTFSDKEDEIPKTQLKLENENKNTLYKLSIYQQFIESKRLKEIVTKNLEYIKAGEILNLEFRLLKDLINYMIKKNERTNVFLDSTKTKNAFNTLWNNYRSNLTKNQKDWIYTRTYYRVTKLLHSNIINGNHQLAIKIYQLEYLAITRVLTEIFIEKSRTGINIEIEAIRRLSIYIHELQKIMDINIVGDLVDISSFQKELESIAKKTIKFALSIKN